MTEPPSPERCQSCGSLLVSPDLAPHLKTAFTADYVCLKCGRPYWWAAHPRRLVTSIAAVPIESSADPEDEEDD